MIREFSAEGDRLSAYVLAKAVEQIVYKEMAKTKDALDSGDASYFGAEISLATSHSQH